MNRTTRYKIAYGVALAVVGTLAYVAIERSGNGIGSALLVAAALLVPGRIQGVYYREMFNGRRLLDLGNSTAAKERFELFLGQLALRPWINRLLWLSWSFYTPSVEAMTWNNIACCELEQGRMTEAKEAIDTALALDPLYPLPYFNLAVLYELGANRSDAERALEKANELGYSGGTVDAVVRRGQSILAGVESRGVRAS
jgi:tetratricopeptide (TPR) repeat protein